jgi:hypothetical protein
MMKKQKKKIEMKNRPPSGVDSRPHGPSNLLIIGIDLLLSNLGQKIELCVPKYKILKL